MAKRQLSQAAQAAKLIRKQLKDWGIPARVKSETYSMGSSVGITVTDLPPAMYQKVYDFANRFQYGTFNSMEDIYEYTNSRDDIPQAKYVFVRNEYSEELRKLAFEFAKKNYSYFDDIEYDRITWDNAACNLYNDLLNGREPEFWEQLPAQLAEKQNAA